MIAGRSGIRAGQAFPERRHEREEVVCIRHRICEREKMMCELCVSEETLILIHETPQTLLWREHK